MFPLRSFLLAFYLVWFCHIDWGYARYFFSSLSKICRLKVVVEETILKGREALIFFYKVKLNWSQSVKLVFVLLIQISYLFLGLHWEQLPQKFAKYQRFCKLFGKQTSQSVKILLRKYVLFSFCVLFIQKSRVGVHYNMEWLFLV